MFCPILKVECMKKTCAWYSGSYEACSVLLTGESLSEISVTAEDKGVKVILDGD